MTVCVIVLVATMVVEEVLVVVKVLETAKSVVVVTAVLVTVEVLVPSVDVTVTTGVDCSRTRFTPGAKIWVRVAVGSMTAALLVLNVEHSKDDNVLSD